VCVCVLRQAERTEPRTPCGRDAASSKERVRARTLALPAPPLHSSTQGRAQHACASSHYLAPARYTPSRPSPLRLRNLLIPPPVPWSVALKEGTRGLLVFPARSSHSPHAPFFPHTGRPLPADRHPARRAGPMAGGIAGRRQAVGLLHAQGDGEKGEIQGEALKKMQAPSAGLVGTPPSRARDGQQRGIECLLCACVYVCVREGTGP